MQPSDNEWLGQYVRNKDSDAMLSLIQRHSAMVMGVCKSLLWNDQDIEDAFQATFLVLSEKAHRLLGHSSVVGWIHQVAVRNCLHLRRQKTRKREVELSQEPAVNSNEPWRSISDLHDRELVHQELRRLPKKYRDVMILCHVDGKSRVEAANALNCTTASVKAALARGKKLLRQRLVRQGIVASSVLAVLASATLHARQSINTELLKATLMICQGSTPEPGFGSSLETIQTLAQKELLGMNVINVGKAAIYTLIGITLVSVPLVLMAQNNKSALEPISVSAQENESNDLASPVSIENPTPNANLTSNPNLVSNSNPSPANNPTAASTLQTPEQEQESLLFQVSKDSIEYWRLMMGVWEARLGDAGVLKERINQGSADVSIFEARARELEAQAKILQISLLLKELQKRKEADQNEKEATFSNTNESGIPPASSDEILPGETLTIESRVESSINRMVVVQADHTVTLPFIGDVDLSGLSQTQAREKINEELKRFIKNPMVDLFRGERPRQTGDGIPLASTVAIQPGEVLSVESFGDSTLNRRVRVQADFTITIPLIGVIKGEGLTPKELTEKVNISAKRFVQSPMLQVYRGGVNDPSDQ